MTVGRGLVVVAMALSLFLRCAPAKPPILEQVGSELRQVRGDPLYDPEPAQEALAGAEADLAEAERVWRTRRDFNETRYDRGVFCAPGNYSCFS